MKNRIFSWQFTNELGMRFYRGNKKQLVRIKPQAADSF
ncbi:hypothetical protein LC2W_0711 [Lacticaseibacillus paracasei]|jgi:hypothetical protein|uniref:Uncharacterized protein n=2 Tax=Lacticaseibacillus paracasei subsp. paracasei TaxID=47714 RepID=S2NZG3_LACPA|nr:hypothetical protein LCAZH_0571 [Lacticaseibacillus paracasei]EPC23561.1 hypothetical protein Lpp226_0186 [Lacticaseibacillus paracasei subsp. paracasei Lpp226]EPC29806.1 hypothetical protein Lpp223_2892 [Lacticaseibacillus paracasei subsp. paracasei Lpp223]EPC36498.1 hypothetical protein Lpp225_2482 [Lacticaseibacillus paracasei subsp. paracasei Lpp225]QGV17280.1 Hypothetical protein LCAKO_0707 [Lacticaseibacillus paracasei subsp. paracasei]